MTPQSFSYATVSKNGYIYVPPYGLNESIDYMLKINPDTHEIKKINLSVNSSFEKWMFGIEVNNRLFFVPFNEEKILIVDTNTDSISYLPLKIDGNGKHLQSHIFKDHIISLPYGDKEPYDYILHVDTHNNKVEQIKIDLPKNDTKKWHTSQIVDDKIYGLPRGSDTENYFPYRIEYDCEKKTYELIDMSDLWQDYDQEPRSNKKFTTMAKVENKLFSPPYSENPNFDIMMKFTEHTWTAERTGLKKTSRKYFSHVAAKNGKIFFPPAGHDEDWAEMLVVDSNSEEWHILDLDIKKESKKYFAGIENSRGKIYFIPRGGCVCMPEESWKQQGDLTEILVIDSITEKYYTIDISEHFKNNTTIEKYNNCVIVKDKIFALPYGESENFQTLLIFDTIEEKIICTIDLNEL